MKKNVKINSCPFNIFFIVELSVPRGIGPTAKVGNRPKNENRSVKELSGLFVVVVVVY